MAVVRSPASRSRSPVRAVNRAAVASRNPANSSKSPDAKAASKAAKADNRLSAKHYGSVRFLIPRFSRGIFYWITMRDERQSNCLTNATAIARIQCCERIRMPCGQSLQAVIN